MLSELINLFMWCIEKNIIDKKIIKKILDNSNFIHNKIESRHFINSGKVFFFKYKNFKILRLLIKDILEKLNLNLNKNDLVLDHTYLLYKSSSKDNLGNKTHPHQDIDYWLDKKNAETMFTIWIPLEDIDQTKGCLVLNKKNQFDIKISGNKLNSNKIYLKHIINHENSGFNRELNTEEVKNFEKQELESLSCKAGDVIIFDCFEPHSSTPNYSGYTRKAMKIVIGYKTTGGLANLNEIINCEKYIKFIYMKLRYLLFKVLNKLIPIKKPAI